FEAGALDVFLTPVVMKKGRPGVVLTALAPHDRLDAVSRVLFEESPTIGVRWSERRRSRLAREVVMLPTAYGVIPFKVSRLAGRGRAQPDGVAAVEVPADDDVEAGTRAPAGLLGELEDDPVEHDGVVAGDDARVLVTQDLLEIDPPERDEGGDGSGRWVGELGVDVGQEALAQVPVGGGDRGDAGHAQLVDEPALQRAVHALTAAAGLGRV